jgi:hypothetical protein
MIVIRTTLDVLAEKRLEIKQNFLTRIAPIGEEPGCIGYCVFCDNWNENLFILPLQFGVLLETKRLLSEPPRFQIHTVSRNQGVAVIHSARKQG